LHVDQAIEVEIDDLPHIIEINRDDEVRGY